MVRSTVRSRSLLVSALAAALVAACGGATTSDGSSADNAVSARGKVYQRGVVLDGRTNKPIEGAVVASGSSSVTTDKDGSYALPVDYDTPFFMEVHAKGYWDFTDMEIKLQKDATRKTMIPSNADWLFWDAMAGGHDDELGVLAVSAWSRGNCLAGDDPLVAKADGVTFTLHTDGDADLSGVKLVYLKHSVPELLAKSAQTGSLPHAIFYDVPVGVNVWVTMDNAPCPKLDYPVEWHDMIYTTGAIKTVPGKAWSFTRAWEE